MQMSEKAKRLLALWEGSKPNVYLDVAGLPTIGVGHLLTKDELSSGEIFIKNVPVKHRFGLTAEQAIDLLTQDLKRFEQVVSGAATVPLNQNQFDALVSFSFNAGAQAFKNSTLLRLLNQGQYAAVPAQLRRWVYAGNRVIQGLANRREREIQLWLGQV